MARVVVEVPVENNTERELSGNYSTERKGKVFVLCFFFYFANSFFVVESEHVVP